MKKIYLVTDGEYSDYHVVGIFSTKKKAEKVSNLLPDSSVEIYLMDEQENWIPRDVWETVIYVADGRVDPMYTRKNVGHELASPKAKLRHVKHDFWNCYDILHVSSFVSAKHSLKLAVEIRQKILRERALNPKYTHPEVVSSGVWF